MINKINNKVKQYKSEGFKFNEATSEGYGDNRIELHNSNGDNLGFIEYSVKDNVITIDEVYNLTKRQRDWKTGEVINPDNTQGTPNVAEKLVDKIVSLYPDKQIEWDAVTESGRNFKKRYLNTYPELKNKVTGISTKEELDTHIQNDYNNQKEVSQDEKRNISSKQTGYRGSVEQGTLSNDRTTTTSNSTKGRKSIPNREGNLPESNSRVDSGRNTTDSDLSPIQLKLDFNSIDEVVDAVGKGEFKHQTIKDVDNLVEELEKFTPYEKTT